MDIFGGKDAQSDRARAAAVYLAEHVSVERGAKTYNINITAGSEDAQKAANIADKIVTVYIAEQRRQQSETVQQTSEELTAPLNDLKAKLEKAEQLVENFKSQNDLIGVEGRMIDDEAILRLNDQLSVAKGQTIALNARAKSMKDVTLEGVVGGGLPEEVNSPVLTALRGQYSIAKQKLDGIATKLGNLHPERIQSESELASIRTGISAEIRRVSSSMQTDLKRAIQTEQDLAGRLAELKARQGNMGDDMIKLRELQRDVDVKRSVYEAYLLRAGQTAEQVGLNTSNISLIVPPRAAQDPVGTSRKVVVIAGFFAGLGLGLALAILKGIVDSVRSQLTGNARPTPRAKSVVPAPGDGSGGGMFQPRKPRNIVESVRGALPGRREQSAPVAEMPLQGFAPRYAEPAQPSPYWDPQPPTFAAAPVAQAPIAFPQMAPAMARPVQQWPVQPPMTYPQQMVQPGPMMYPQPVYAHQPAFVPQHQMPQPGWSLPQPIMPQPVQVQMPVYAQPLHPFAQEAQRSAPVQPSSVPQPVVAAPVQEQRHGYAAGDPRLAEIQESIEEFRSALTDFARRRRA